MRDAPRKVYGLDVDIVVDYLVIAGERATPPITTSRYEARIMAVVALQKLIGKFDIVEREPEGQSELGL